jgi:SP family general alpha glucoside:H+ symporter-like MFS transporter
VTQAILGLPQFRQSFGILFDGEYVIPAKWLLGWSGASLAGLAVGAIMAGFIAEKLGRKWSFMVAFSELSQHPGNWATLLT